MKQTAPILKGIITRITTKTSWTQKRLGGMLGGVSQGVLSRLNSGKEPDSSPEMIRKIYRICVIHPELADVAHTIEGRWLAWLKEPAEPGEGSTHGPASS